MTTAGQRRKPRARPILLAGALALAVTAGLSLSSGAATTERVVTDRLTGLALAGFDPVAYFTDAQALVGREELELPLAGTIWRFRNEGNRAAFAADPAVYLPRFGGYDPVSLARGVSVPGHPELWLIENDRLYLFRTPAARDAFHAHPDRALARAEEKWPKVLRTLVR